MPATARPLGAVLAVGACVLGFAAGGLAHADNTYSPANYAPWSGPQGDHDPNAYRADVARYGVTGSAGQAEGLAHTICAALRDPKLEDADLIQRMADANAYRVPAMTLVVHAAEWHFCPDRY